MAISPVRPGGAGPGSGPGRPVPVSLVLAAMLISAGCSPLPIGERTPEITLQDRLEMLVEDPVFRGVQVGISVRAADPPTVVAEVGADRMLTPASTVKLFTSGTALTRLGSSYAFVTRLVHTGRLDEHGVLHGDLVLVGGGDPSFPGGNSGGLGLDLYEVWVDMVRTLGVLRVEGQVVGTDDFFEDRPLGPGWCWDDQGFPFSAELASLNFNDNCVRVFVGPGAKVGDPGRAWFWPRTRYVTVDARARTVEAGEPDSVVIRRSVCENLILCEGTVELGAQAVSERIAVSDPVLYTATVFDEVLRAGGVDVRGAPAKRSGLGSAPDTTWVTEHISPPLREMIKKVNKESDNLYAEALLRTLGRELRDQGSVEAGLMAVRQFAAACGIDSTALVLVDGSGLSRLNALSADAVTRFLSCLAAHEQFWDFYQSLAIAGVDGTLESRFLGAEAQGVLRGKSGSMNGVSCLSGYAVDRRGDQIVFSILLNGYRADGGSLTDLVDLLAAEVSESAAEVGSLSAQ